jgi:hypothetical protein
MTEVCLPHRLELAMSDSSQVQSIDPDGPLVLLVPLLV